MVRDLVCLSHLRWDFVYQRPNHLMARAARDRRVYFVEEPIYDDEPVADLRVRSVDGVHVVTPTLPTGLGPAAEVSALARLMDRLVQEHGIEAPTLWYYTPMALPWTRSLERSAVVYDSMDYLAGFRGAPASLLDLEVELLQDADLVFCGGASLHERMRSRHRAVHLFPSSVDVAHFGRARGRLPDPEDQAAVPTPRIGYAGVIDERIDLDLVRAVARMRPDWQVVMLGPVAKIDEADLPIAPNIVYLGRKAYDDLPAYLAGWSIGWMPFARNEATRYISPTKTPEYLAAGLSVVSTSVRDVVEPYGVRGLAMIADDVDATVAAMDAALASRSAGLIAPHRRAVDAFLDQTSWDRSWDEMDALVRGLGRREEPVWTPRLERDPVPAVPAVPVVVAAEVA